MSSALSEYLQRKFLDYQNARGKRVSQAEWGRWLWEGSGIEPDLASLSNWVTGSRNPGYKTVSKVLARKLGEEIYAVTGYSLPMPEDPLYQKAVRLLQEVDDETRLEFIAMLEQKVAGKGHPATH